MRTRSPRSAWTTLRATLVLLGSFAFAYNVVVVLHEIGHVVAAWASGGKPHSLRLHPFSTSSVEVVPDPRPLVTHAAGVVAPPLVGLALLRALRAIRTTPLRLPLLVIPSVACASSGLYLLVGITLEVGDAAVLSQGGIPRAVLIATGLGCIFASALLVRRPLALLGLDGGSTPLQRAVILGGGVGTYLLAIVGWQLARVPDYSTWMALAGGGAALLALIGWWAPRVVPVGGDCRDGVLPLSWKDAASALALGCLLIALELVWL